MRSVTAFFANAALVHVNHSPLVLTLVGDNAAAVGARQALALQLRPALDPLRSCVESADNNTH